MPERKISLERGDLSEVWAGGRGYQQPASRPEGGDELPPDWDVAPHEEESGRSGDPQGPISPSEPGPIPGPATPDDQILAAVQYELSRLEIPEELVNLDKHTARFRGHSLELAPETVASIHKLLANEVVRKLEEEQKRVIESVLDPRLPKLPSGSGTNVPVVQKPKKPVGKKASKRPKKVRRMRQPAASIKPKDVRLVPGSEDLQAGEGPDS